MKYENIEFMKRLKFWWMKTINQLKASGRCLKTPAFFMCFSSGRRGDYQHPVDQNPFLLPSHSLEKSFSGWKGSLPIYPSSPSLFEVFGFCRFKVIIFWKKMLLFIERPTVALCLIQKNIQKSGGLKETKHMNIWSIY